MNKQLLFDFYAFRKWFSKMFSLSLDGKFKILSGYYRKPASDVICIRLSGYVIKLYNC